MTYAFVRCIFIFVLAQLENTYPYTHVTNEELLLAQLSGIPFDRLTNNCDGVFMPPLIPSLEAAKQSLSTDDLLHIQEIEEVTVLSCCLPLSLILLSNILQEVLHCYILNSLSSCVQLLKH